jgi:cytochrome c oxidase subunit III
MELGTAEIVDDRSLPKRRRPGVSIGTGTPSGGNGGGDNGGGSSGGGGGDDPQQFSKAREPFVPGKSRILTGLLLLIVIMTFGGLIAAYVVIATNNVPEWRPFALPLQLWISTALIIVSSIFYQLGKRAADNNYQIKAKQWFIVTTVFGAAFISSQLLAWFELRSRGLYLAGNPYAGFFYVMTALHALHVLGGITALSTILIRSWYPTEQLVEILRRRSIAEVVGWYWHFMGALWIVLLLLLGFWK